MGCACQEAGSLAHVLSQRFSEAHLKVACSSGFETCTHTSRLSEKKPPNLVQTVRFLLKTSHDIGAQIPKGWA